MALNAAIVGSGPAGFYVAEALLQSDLDVRVDMIERLPVPFGLVRHGVAPDHQKLKAVTAVFEEIARDENFSFLGNLQVGRDIDIADLRASYDVVVIATGAISDRQLGVAGENLTGSVSATEFVGWYNGHPDFRDRSFDLSHSTAVVVGNGNVALDVCRILSKSVDELKRSDICEHALEALAGSKVTDIFLVGRRGPIQSKFTTKELREFGGLKLAEPVVDPSELELNEASMRELDGPAGITSAKNLEILRSFAKPTDRRRKPVRIHFRFQLSPLRIEGRTQVERAIFAEVRLCGPAFDQIAEPIGREVGISTGLLVRSVGYRGTPIPGVPFDDRSATIPHKDGRVQTSGGMVVPGLYVAGWIKRGPSGVIGTNRACGVDTALAILSDLQSLSATISSDRRSIRESFLRSLRARLLRPVDFAGWLRIDALERAAGAAREKPREKMTTRQAMIEASEGRADLIPSM
jgi:ferredoxin/flavodoxin---NADP+ reductase